MTMAKAANVSDPGSTAKTMIAANTAARTVQLLRELEAEFGCSIVAYQQEAALAQLTPEGHVKLRQLENEFGVALVACEPTVRFSLAQPSEEQLERLRATERELELILAAYAQERAAPMRAPMPGPAGTEQLATLSEGKLDRLHASEEETGLVLMAYKTVTVDRSHDRQHRK